MQSTLKTSDVVGGVEVPAVPTGLFIGGEWRDAAGGETFDDIAPFSEEHLATVASAQDADIDAAVAAARAQFDGGEWSRVAPADRGRLLYRLAELMERDIETLITLEALDVGKPVFEARFADIPCAIDTIRHFAGWADKIEGRWVTPAPFFGHARQAYTIRDHSPPSNCARAAATAASMSASCALATLARCSSENGATSSKVSPPAASRHSPPMNRPVGTSGTATPPTTSLVFSALSTFTLARRNRESYTITYVITSDR